MKKIICLALVAAMMLTMSVTVFAGELDQSADVTVDYTYEEGANTAEKKLSAVLEYTLPTTVTVTGGDTEYTWDAANGKYVAGTPAADTYALENDGAFSIKVTNKSNVDINYEVSYAANNASLFTNELDGDMTNASGKVATVAAGQEVGEENIVITDVTAATATGKTFNNATCTGALKITAVNGTLAASGSGVKLGAFTVKIEEAAAIATVADLAKKMNPYPLWDDATNWDNPNIWYYNDGRYDHHLYIENNELDDNGSTIPLTTPVTKTGENKYTVVRERSTPHDKSVFTVTFELKDDAVIEVVTKYESFMIMEEIEEKMMDETKYFHPKDK